MLRYFAILIALFALTISQFQQTKFLDAPENKTVSVSVLASFGEADLREVRFLRDGSSPIFESFEFNTVLTITPPFDGYVEFPRGLVSQFADFDAVNLQGETTTDCRVTKRKKQTSDGTVEEDNVNTACRFITLSDPSTRKMDDVFSSVVIGFVDTGTVSFTVIGRDFFGNELQLIQTLQLFSTEDFGEIILGVLLFVGFCFVGFCCCFEGYKYFFNCGWDDSYECDCCCCDSDDDDGFYRDRDRDRQERRRSSSSTSRAPREEVTLGYAEYMNRNRGNRVPTAQAEVVDDNEDIEIGVAEPISGVINYANQPEIPMAETYQGHSTTL